MHKILIFVGGAFALMILLTLITNLTGWGVPKDPSDDKLKPIYMYTGKKTSSSLEDTVALFDNNTKVVVPQDLMKHSDTLTYIDLTTQQVSQLSLNPSTDIFFSRFEVFDTFVFAHYYTNYSNGSSQSVVYKIDATGTITPLTLVEAKEVNTYVQNSSQTLTRIVRPDAVESTDGLGFYSDTHYIVCGNKTGYVTPCTDYPKLLPLAVNTASRISTVQPVDTLQLGTTTITAVRDNPNEPIDITAPYFNWIRTLTFENQGTTQEIKLKQPAGFIVTVGNEVFVIGRSVYKVVSE